MATTSERLTALEKWRVKVDAVLWPVVDPPPPPPPPPPPTGHIIYLNQQSLKSGSSYVDCTFKRNALDLTAYALVGDGIAGATLRDVRLENLRGIKIGTGSLSTGINIDRLTAVNTGQAIFLANAHDCTWRDLDLSAVDWTGTKNHVLYLERDVKNLSIINLKCRGGLGQSLHFYTDSDVWGQNVAIDGVDIVNDHHGAVVIQKYTNVAIRNGRLQSGGGEAAIKLYAGVADMLFENLDCWATRLYETTGAVSRVTFRGCRLNGVLVPDVTL